MSFRTYAVAAKRANYCSEERRIV